MGTLLLGWQFQPPSTAADASSNDAVVFYHVQVLKCLILSYLLQGEGIWDLILLWALLEEWLELWGMPWVAQGTCHGSGCGIGQRLEFHSAIRRAGRGDTLI